MGITRILAEYAAAAANLHPDHLSSYDDLVASADRTSQMAGRRASGQSAFRTPKSSSSSTSR